MPLAFPSVLIFLEEKKFAKANPYISVAGKVACEGVAHLEQFFQDVVDSGGEGIILRNPHSPYEPGRSAGYLKHKVGTITLTHILRDDKYLYS